ncbi:50S ribosomal protein L19 [Candidatus Uhrbacteria bacterium CG_4_9_14_3_um_filter_36_7]|uniref:50S ribosomal protein L19 n=1 Tax=Candidatus Uhrbacteria bacterium CG_4_9_14_3_um_filter_36_7 TaxID=1975033 RepID=A0A2M7XFY4_9BACT|nr:MAG: 50S ribosomal protein L19 [Candidatus Uhrbacteria bacterium CG_4_9_14_3_um_filter_36_7]
MSESETINQEQVLSQDLHPGMTIRIHERIKDVSSKGEERERIQIFEGMIIGMRGSGISKTMTIRRVHKGFGVEKIYPLKTPSLTKIEVVKTAKIRRAKLSFLQNLKKPFKRKLRETFIKS